MITEYEVYFLIGVILATLSTLLFPVVRQYLNQFYQFLVRKLGKDTADVLKSLFKALIQFIIQNKDKIIGRILKSTKVKVDKKDVDSIEDGFKKGKDFMKK